MNSENISLSPVSPKLSAEEFLSQSQSLEAKTVSASRTLIKQKRKNLGG